MKYLCIVLWCLSSSAIAQVSKDSVPLPQYLKTKEVPGFKLLLMDSSTYFYKYQLKKNTPTVIIYFNPDCDHCQTEAAHLVDSMRYVKKAQFVFASYSKFSEIKAFAIKYQLSTQPNIKVGRDENFYIPSFYRVRFTPFVAVYNKKGALVQVFEGGTSILNLSKLL